jgi:hypothetical protein
MIAETMLRKLPLDSLEFSLVDIIPRGAPVLKDRPTTHL